MKTTDVRSQLAYALRDDLIGPDLDDPRDAAHLQEALSSAPSHWYLAGFLAPTAQKPEEKEDDEANDDLTSAVDDPSDGEADAPVARRPLFPSSMGLSVLVPRDCITLNVRVTYGTYAPAPKSDPPPRSSRAPDGDEEDGQPIRLMWTRTQQEHQVALRLDGPTQIEQRLNVAGSTDSLVLRLVLRP